MPVYQIFHAIPLSDQQQDDLAEAITTLHTTKFGVLRLFVNVSFANVSQQNTYIGGKRRKGNHIRVGSRQGDRTVEDFQQLSRSIEEAWYRIVTHPAELSSPQADIDSGKFKLHTLIIQTVNPIGLEHGFEIPQAGEDVAWLKKNWSAFKQRAQDGEEEFVDLVAEAKEKGFPLD